MVLPLEKSPIEHYLEAVYECFQEKKLSYILLFKD
jgi:hypothetical protein